MKTDIISPNWNIHPLTTLHYMLTWISEKTHPRRGSVSWSCVPCDLMSCWWYMVVGSTNWVCVQDTSRNKIFRIQDLMMYNDVQSLECTFMIIYVHLLWASHIQLCPCWIQVIYHGRWRHQLWGARSLLGRAGGSGVTCDSWDARCRWLLWHPWKHNKKLGIWKGNKYGGA